MSTLLLLAQSDDVSMDDLFRDVDYRSVIIYGSLALVALAAFIWAAFFRRRRRRHHHFHRPRTAPPPAEKHRSWSWRRLLGLKRRRHRRHPRRSNPTLAQSGGLPPIRAEDSPPAAD